MWCGFNLMLIMFYLIGPETSHTDVKAHKPSHCNEDKLYRPYAELLQLKEKLSHFTISLIDAAFA